LGRAPAGANLMYFETGQGAALSAQAHHGVDQQTMEARAYAVARRYAPLLVNTVVGFIALNISTTARKSSARARGSFLRQVDGPADGCRCLLHQPRRGRSGRYGHSPDAPLRRRLQLYHGRSRATTSCSAINRPLTTMRFMCAGCWACCRHRSSRPGSRLRNHGRGVSNPAEPFRRRRPLARFGAMMRPPGDFWDYLRRVTPAALRSAAWAMDCRRTVCSNSISRMPAPRCGLGKSRQCSSSRRTCAWRPVLVRSAAPTGRLSCRDRILAAASRETPCKLFRLAPMMRDRHRRRLSAGPYKPKRRHCAKCFWLHQILFLPASRGTPGARCTGRRHRGKTRGGACRRPHRRAPGLSACDSMGAYITFDPKPGVTRDANRNCVSNIRGQGLSLDEASRRILAIMGLARTIRQSGTCLRKTTLSIYCRQGLPKPITRRHPVLRKSRYWAAASRVGRGRRTGSAPAVP